MENLSILRKQKGVYQKDVAEAIGVSRAVYSTYEVGVAEPSISTLCKLADYFQISVDELIGKCEIKQLFADCKIPRSQIELKLDKLNSVEEARVLGYIEAVLDERKSKKKKN